MEQKQITNQDILDNFGRETYYRGFEYFKASNVVKCDVTTEENQIVIRSTVHGSYLYEQNIILFFKSNKLFLITQCSCPVINRCKHSVASLLYFIKFLQKENPFPIQSESERWMENLLKTQLPKSLSHNPKSEYFLIYRLFSHSYQDVELFKVKKLKNGLLSKGILIKLENCIHNLKFNQNHYEFFEPEDIALVNQLEHLMSLHKTIFLNNEFGVFVIKKMCETNRCYFQESTTPLRFEESSKTLRFDWYMEEDKNILYSSLKPSETLILRTKPFLCADKETNTIFPMQTTYTKEEIKCLNEAPPLTQKEAEKITKTVLKQMPKLNFPLLPTIEIEEIKTPPKPLLRLHSTNVENRKIQIAELHFKYGEYRVDAYPFEDTQTRFLNDKNIKILRNETDEKHYKERIESFGFEYDDALKSYINGAKLSMQDAIERWRIFIENQQPLLEDEGWEIEIAQGFQYQFEYIENITLQSEDQSDANPWFSLSFNVDIGGKNISLVPIVASLMGEFEKVDDLPTKLNLQLEEGRFLHIDAEEIKPILRIIFELFERKSDDGTLRINSFDAHLIDLDAHSDVTWKGGKELKELSQKLRNFQGIEAVTPPQYLNATLREYQQLGLNWLNFLHTFKFGGILADDMGLGKTIQTLAFLQHLKEKGELTKPSLIVMPTSLMGNWKNEIATFAPQLTYLELYGLDRAEKFSQIAKYDIVLTTYSLAQRDEERYLEENFYYIILDEAQKIKNAKTKMAVSIKSLNSSHKLALSGTPIENHLGELWSIFDFLMAGFFQTQTFFKNYYQTPIEVNHDMTIRTQLNKKIAPFILRRTKDEVVKELPPKTEIIKKAIFGKKQATLYENIRVTMEQKVKEAIQGKGLARSHITILDALLKLRQVCCDPSLLKLENAKAIKESAKLEMLLELIDELHEEGRKVLVFSQFTSMLSIIEKEITKRNISYVKLTGATRKREETIAQFTQGNASIFLISLKAGGVGLNLVEADTVIHYDPWWNPAVENQATDRAYRIGQDKPVFVYKLIVENSIEEQILKLQERKKSLQDTIHKSEEESNKESFSGKELLELLSLQ